MFLSCDIIVSIMSSTILNNTDMMFLLSDFLDDSSAVQLFNTQKSYKSMIAKFPKRYKNKKKIICDQLKKELEKWNGTMIGHTADKTYYIQFNMGGWNEIWLASLDEYDGEVWFRINSGEVWKLKWEASREFKHDPVLLQALQRLFNC